MSVEYNTFTAEEREHLLTILDGAERTRFVTRYWKRRRRVIELQIRLNKIPPWNLPFFQYISAFWIGLIDEGPRDLLTPRWGGITFGWLNDGMKPTVWHTLRQLFYSQTDPYTGIYPRGAPKSLAQAEEWDAELRERE